MERLDQPILPSGNETFSSEDPLYDVIDMEYLLRKLRESLRTEVLFSRNISGLRLKVLQNYMSLLIHYFPSDKPKIYEFFNALMPWLLSKETLEVLCKNILVCIRIIYHDFKLYRRQS